MSTEIPYLSDAEIAAVSEAEVEDYPYAVVWRTESASYTRASVSERDTQLRAQAAQAIALEAWKNDQRPDRADKLWAAYQEFVSMISRSPHGVKRSRGAWQGSARTRHAAVDTLLAVVPRGYGKRDGVIEW